MSLFVTAEEMSAAFVNSDRSFDGAFYAATRNTGVFCNPGCTTRKTSPDNIEFFETVREVMESGYRPCNRCRPLEGDRTAPEWLEPLLRAIESEPRRRWRDSDLRELGVEPSVANRYFQTKYGMTLQAFLRARSLSEAHTDPQDDRIDPAEIQGAFESLDAFSAVFERLFGPPAPAERAGRVVLTTVGTPIGPTVLGATERGVCLLEYTSELRLQSQFARIRKWHGEAAAPGENKHLAAMRSQLGEYFAGTRREFTVPLDAVGTPFQEKVWAALRAIPYGATRSYGDLARHIGSPTATRAVAHANGDNVVAIVIPCHRVIGSDGALTGYGGGLWRKRALLALESR
jgi:AraC family transcriptional regulator of adaptative response/methylated-DNA-[protein]-cysteine methyltransferase